MRSTIASYAISIVKDVALYTLFTVSILNTFSGVTITIPLIVFGFLSMVLSIFIGVNLRDKEGMRYFFRAPKSGPISSWKKGLALAIVLIPAAAFISLEPEANVWPIFAFSLSIYMGYDAESNRRSGQQPYQKYSWFPTTPAEMLKFPYTGAKILWKKYVK